MNVLSSRARGFLTLLLVGAATSCSSSTEPVGDGSDFEGFWQLTVDVTLATGVCAGEEDDPVEVHDVLITQEGSVITATAMWSDESGSVSLTGARDGNAITFGGSYAEDGGTTTTMYSLSILAEGDSLDGVENWSWTGGGGDCPASRSLVTGVPR